MLRIDSKRRLHNGHEMPLFGLGVFQIENGAECVRQVQQALDLGYRHIDTARGYRNEESVGKAIRESGIPREEIFVTSKLWCSDFPADLARRAVDDSIAKMGLDSIDLYLIHWPVRDFTEEAWEILREKRDEGKLKSIGVSNFTVRRFEEQFLPKVKELPVVNQIERHPFFPQNDVVNFGNEREIFTVAYSPLVRAERMNEPALVEIAGNHGKSAAQILLRWQLQQDVGVIPKSSSPKRLEENADIFDFELSAQEMAQINELDENQSIIGFRPEDNWF